MTEYLAASDIRRGAEVVKLEPRKMQLLMALAQQGDQRLLGVGELKSKIDIEVSYATAGARMAVEKAGGSVTATEPRGEDKPASKGKKQ